MEPKRAETSFCFSCSTLTQNVPLASMACQDRDTLVGQNSTSGGSSDSAANDWQAKPTGASSCTVVMTVMPVQNWPSTLRNVRGSIGAAHRRHGYLKPTLKSWPHRLTGGALPGDPVLVVDLSPSQPNSTSNPPGVFM